MSTSTWLSLATQTLNRLGLTDACRVAILGIGNEINGDDAVGSIVATDLMQSVRGASGADFHNQRLIIPAGPVPENFTGKLRNFHPDLVIVIDAAQLDTTPGQVVWVPWYETVGMSASTHSLPISIFAKYLTAELGCEVFLIGIQAGNNEIGEELSIPVATAANEVVQGLVDLLFPQV